MIDLSEILQKAYKYTRNHKFLWFFGFFLTGWGTGNFIRRVDLNADRIYLHIQHLIIRAHHRPVLLAFTTIVTMLVLLGISVLGAIGRSLIIHSGLHLERREEVTFKEALKHTEKKHWRVFWIGLYISISMLVILSWLAVPLYFVFRHGVDTRAVLLVLLALAIFIPVIVILSLVNIFSACYVVVYDLKIFAAIRGSFDLLAGFWEKTMSLFMILFVIYCGLLLLSATIVGLSGFVAYGLFAALKALPASIIFDILVVITSVLLISVNSILNVFTNFAWTLFFLKIVKVKFIEEGAVVAVSS